MAEPVRVGIIGCGKIATVDHCPGFKSAGAELVAFCDIVEDKAVALRDKFNPSAKVCTDYRKLLRMKLDAVAICTPNYLHYPMTKAALAKGLHVVCEKPLSATSVEAQRLVQAAAKAGRILHVNQSFHYLAPYRRIASLMAEGAIGRPIHVRCLRAGGSTPDKGWSPGASWFVSSAAQGGVILDIAVHMADLMKWCVGPVTEIAAVVNTRTEGIDVPDNVAALMRFANGATGVLELSWTMPAGGGMLEIYGTQGRIRNGFTTQPIELTTVRDGQKETTYPEPEANVAKSQACFLAAVRGEGKSLSPGELGRDAVALCEAIAAAGRKGGFVKVKTYDEA